MPNTNEEFLDLTGLSYFKGRLDTAYPSKEEFDALDDKVDDIISEGGEPNVIEVVKVNGTALTPDSEKAVNVEAVTDVYYNGASQPKTDGTANISGPYLEYWPNTGFEAQGVYYDSKSTILKIKPGTDDTVSLEVSKNSSKVIEETLATTDYVDANGGKIDKIKVNDVEQTITNKTVNITVPEDLEDLTNTGSDPFIQQSDLDAAIVGALKPKGSVAFASLPALTAANLNNVYNVTDAFTTTADFVEGAGKSYPAGTEVAIINNGTDAAPVYKYSVYSGFIDLSDYWNQTNLTAITTAQIDALFT